jgi:hypothetical protein
MLHILSWISLAVAFLCVLVIAFDVGRHPQKMWIMNIVWPVTALYLSVFAVWGYFRIGRNSAKDAQVANPPKSERQKEQSKDAPQAQEKEAPQEQDKDAPPTWSQTALAVSHCGAGCALADIVSETAVFVLGATILGSELWGSYVYDFIAAWSLGVVFQYFTIVPMRHLTPLNGIWAAIKADTFSITAFQIGMYAWMALVYFKLFTHPHLHPDKPEFWFMMQIAMILGFLTSYPMNYLLIRMGWKEKMT